MESRILRGLPVGLRLRCSSVPPLLFLRHASPTAGTTRLLAHTTVHEADILVSSTVCVDRNPLRGSARLRSPIDGLRYQGRFEWHRVDTGACTGRKRCSDREYS